MTLYELLSRDIKRMIDGMHDSAKGNIHPLIMQEIEKYIIQITLDQTAYNLVKASKILGIARSTLYRKLQKLGFDDFSSHN